MKNLSLLLLILFSSTLMAQNKAGFDCDQVFLAYYKATPSTPINDFDAFCQGAYEAFAATQLAQRWHVNPDDIRSCTFYGFEKYGVKLETTHHSENTNINDINAGFNYVMDQRIREKLGKDYELLGNMGPMYFGPDDMFNELFYSQFNSSMTKKKTDDGLFLKLEKVGIFQDYLMDLKVTDRRGNSEFIFSDLFKGVTVQLSDEDIKEQSKLFNFQIADFKDPFFCDAANKPSVFIVWLNLNDFFEKGKNK